MNTKFIVNDYLLIWCLLFQASISEDMYKLKQKLWKTYKEEYNITYKDKIDIVKDYKNFIPDNDTIYNIILDNKDYEKVKKQAEKYRIEIMKLWDNNSKYTTNLIKKIIRMDIPEYTFFVINKDFNTIEQPINGSIILGKEINKEKKLNIIYEILMHVVLNNLKKYKEEDHNFKKAIVELAILNEYATMINKKSYYISGNPRLLSLKRWIYPYWLMYLGVPENDLYTYMMRDKIAYDADKYEYNKDLKKLNLEEFIDYCIENKDKIVQEII